MKTIDEERKAIIEDAKAAGIILGSLSGSEIFEKIVENLTKFAQLQAARNQSNNVPVAWRCNGEVSTSRRYIQDVSTQHSAPIEPLYTSPQQSNALEMAAKDKYIQILEKALHRCIYNATFILNNHNQGASILEANEHELLLAITTKEPFTHKPKGNLIPLPESDGK